MKTITTHAAAAKMIRQHLKAKGIAGTVRSESYTGGSSIRVSLPDASPALYVDVLTYAEQFQYGHFDGMTDSYEYSNDRKDIPQVKFVFVEIDYSAEIKQAAWTAIRATVFDAAELPTNYSELTHHRFWGEYATSQVYRFLRGTMRLPGNQESAFWEGWLAQKQAA